MTRICRVCGEEKPSSEYLTTFKNGRSLRLRTCRACRGPAVRATAPVRLSERRPQLVGYEGLVRAVVGVPESQTRG